MVEIRRYDGCTTITQTDLPPLNVFEPIPGPSRLSERVWLGIVAVFFVVLTIATIALSVWIF